ncbi:MAG: rhomboid family intramembrane serine protease [Desulfamplus sp.]|nr:rhomboid family intramembrane serine protease [Desulfamplus sp.]MBF0258063.1 rhomboid family intramembrane serine protease [Desulfamplus sp.]
MIPIRDTITSRNIPIVTYIVMGLNTLFYIYQAGMTTDIEPFIYTYGFVPAKLTVPEIAAHFSLFDMLFSTVSYMFLHGGLWHFVGNMWFLYIFGDNVEDHLGPLRFAGFYMICGVASAMLHFFLNPLSPIPTIGASGAIAGVMGAYFILYPKAKILTLIPIIIIPWFVDIPAFIFLGFWFLMQFYNATDGGGAGIAWWAHVGGFISGIIMVKVWGELPQPPAEEKLKSLTARKKSPKLQNIHAKPISNSLDLSGNIEITSLESIAGTVKLVNIPWGFYTRLYNVTVPPGVKNSTQLRLTGMGRVGSYGVRGDMYLTVHIKNPIP